MKSPAERRTERAAAIADLCRELQRAESAIARAVEARIEEPRVWVDGRRRQNAREYRDHILGRLKAEHGIDIDAEAKP